MPSSPASPPPGVTFGDPTPVPAGVTFGQPAQAPEGVTFGEPTPPAAPAEDNRPLWQRGVDSVSNLPGMAMARGFMKNAEAGASGLIQSASDVLSGPDVKEVPGTFVAGGGPLGMPSVNVPEGARKAVQKVARPTADWLRKNTDLNGFWESMGGGGELIWELINGQAEANPGKLISLGDRAAEVGKLAKFLEGDGILNRLARVGLKATTHGARASGEMGAQTLVHSQDPDKAVTAAGTGAVVGGAIGAGTGAFRELKEGLKPTVETLEGHEMPVMVNQRPKAPLIAKVLKKAEDNPAFDAVQQAVPEKVITSGSQRATKRVLDQVNETRQILGPVDAAGNPPGSFKFSVDKFDPRVEAETPAEAAATNTQQQIGTQASAVPERVGGGTPTGATQRREQLGSMASTIPEDLIRGKASPIAEKIETTDPNEAVKMLVQSRQLQRIPNLPARLQARVDARVASLEEQLDNYHDARASAPNFKPIDTEAAIRDTHDYETAGEQMQNSVRDVYKRMHVATDGESSTLINQPRYKAMPRLNELFEEHKDKFTKQEWEAATNAWRQGFVSKELHNIVQDGFNMSAENATATGEARRWAGSNQMTKRLDKLMDDHGDDVRNMIGDEGIRSLRRMNNLLKGPDTSGPLIDLVNNVARVMRRHGGSVAGMLGGTVGAMVGGSHYHGALVGVISAAAVQKVLNHLATNPALMERAAYAVENKVPANIAGPLIYSMITRAGGLDEPKKKEEPPK